MVEINLLDLFPKVKRPVEDRGKFVTEEHRRIALQFGAEYFDGDRLNGYGGYYYHPRFWQATARRIRDYYGLSGDAGVLDVGCAKGFLLHDLKELMPDLAIAGIDGSEYAIEHAIEDVKPVVQVGDARAIQFEDNSFDLVISTNTLHNLPLEECKQALREVQRVSRSHSFITVDAWRNQEEYERLMQWNLTAQTFMHVDDWKRLFAEVGYGGDYYWFIPE